MSVRVSTVLGMALMDALEAGGQASTVYVHGLPDDVREQLIRRLEAAGGERRDNPKNNDARGVDIGGANVMFWGPRA